MGLGICRSNIGSEPELSPTVKQIDSWNVSYMSEKIKNNKS